MKFLDFNIDDSTLNVIIVGVVSTICLLFFFKLKREKKLADFDNFLSDSSIAPNREKAVKRSYKFSFPLETRTYMQEKPKLDKINPVHLKELKDLLRARAAEDYYLHNIYYDKKEEKRNRLSSKEVDEEEQEELNNLESYLKQEIEEVKREADELQENWGKEQIDGANNPDFIFSPSNCIRKKQERSKNKNHLRFETF